MFQPVAMNLALFQFGQLACTQNSEAIVYRHQHWFDEVYDIDLSTKGEPRNYHKNII